MDLIIDTTSENLVIILNDTKKGKIYSHIDKLSKHLVHLMPEIDKLLTKHSINLGDIDNFCVALGPGSFTGVRIGVATTKSFLAVYKKAKIIGFNVLDVMFRKILNENTKSDFLILIKSTSTKFYGLMGSKDGKKKFERLITKDEILDILKKNNIQVYSLNEEFLFNDTKTKLVCLCENDYLKNVEEQKKYKLFLAEEELKPVYMALSQAEVELAKREQKAN